MSKLGRMVCSSVAQKLLMGLTGLFLVLFLVLHLVGNLLLYFPNPDLFNTYAYRLDSLGTLKYVAEIGLILLFGAHIVSAVRLKRNHKAARPEGYSQFRTKGGPSKANASSMYMAVSGMVILVFLIVHVWHFRFGPGIAEGFTATLGGETVRDLHRLVVESFQNPLYVGFYLLATFLVGVHLRHGIWSAFQSLGLNRPGFTKPLYTMGWFLGALLALGFFAIPIYLFVRH